MDLFSIIVIVAIFTCLIIDVIISVKKDGLRKTAIEFIVRAENMYEKGMNTEKFDYVFDIVYNSIPGFFKI